MAHIPCSIGARQAEPPAPQAVLNRAPLDSGPAIPVTGTWWKAEIATGLGGFGTAFAALAAFAAAAPAAAFAALPLPLPMVVLAWNSLGHFTALLLLPLLLLIQLPPLWLLILMPHHLMFLLLCLWWAAAPATVAASASATAQRLRPLLLLHPLHCGHFLSIAKGCLVGGGAGTRLLTQATGSQLSGRWLSQVPRDRPGQEITHCSRDVLVLL